MKMVNVDAVAMGEHADRLNRLAEYLMKQASDWSNKGEPNPPPAVSAAVLGFMLTAPFALELALKALHAQHANGQVPKTHDLVVIMTSLNGTTIKSIEERLTNIRATKYPEHKNSTITAAQVITDWRLSPEMWETRLN